MRRRALLLLVVPLCLSSAVPAHPAGEQAPLVQPGSAIDVSGVPCSAGFLFRGRDGTRWLSTAGHCVVSRGSATTRAGDRTWGAGRGPVVRAGSGGPVVGHVSYATHVPGTTDFALVRLVRGAVVSPETVAGTPVTSPRGHARVGDGVTVVGSGVGASMVAPARAGVVSGVSEGHALTITAPALPGDSGGPVTAQGGGALGLLIRGGGFVVPDPGTAQVIRLPVMLNRVRKELSLTLSLWTST